jgi:YidC/Oxa1 family membrane protein insertase
MPKKFLNYLLIGLVISLGFQLFIQPSASTTVDPNVQPITFKTAKKEYVPGKVVDLKITNNTASPIVFASMCPSSPFQAFKVENNSSVPLTSAPSIDCQNNPDASLQNIILRPNKTNTVRYTYWSHDLFGDFGEYKIGTQYTLDGKTYKSFSNTFEVRERNFLSKFWLTAFYQPIYNFLILIISYVPNYSLGLAIIILTLLIRLALYIPNQKALLAQKRLAEVQPKLNAIKDKHKDNQQKAAEETMKLWKEHKVNPASSCLPMLIQFPILIALFYVIQDGLNPDKQWLLYNFISNFDLANIQTNFFGILELTQKNIFVLPIVVGALQFIQLKISLAKNTKDKDKKSDDPQVAIQATMLYVMPAMIAVFTASLPAGVGIYWGTSTLFGIFQQYIANKHVTKEMKKDTRVIDVTPKK